VYQPHQTSLGRIIHSLSSKLPTLAFSLHRQDGARARAPAPPFTDQSLAADATAAMLAPDAAAEPPPVERLTGVTYYSRAQLEQGSPSRRDGVSAEQEAEWRAEYTAIISEAGMRLRM
jgi:hypothetical protein